MKWSLERDAATWGGLMSRSFRICYVAFGKCWGSGGCVALVWFVLFVCALCKYCVCGDEFEICRNELLSRWLSRTLSLSPGNGEEMIDSCWHEIAYSHFHSRPLLSRKRCYRIVLHQEFLILPCQTRQRKKKLDSGQWSTDQGMNEPKFPSDSSSSEMMRG